MKSGITRATQNKQIRQEAIREQLSARGMIEHIIDIADKLGDLSQPLENSDVNRMKAAADIKMRLVNKYLPDLKAVEIEQKTDPNEALAQALAILADKLPS
jgi:DNA uptake protein ComE-like DNA-binding protein